ncbi:16S rRNA (guanine(966)-N(2))-methyltransferase RsmD [OM182 bacterium]|jgi:16S rRNA (guanine966-N2)-methyltransferase|nr:16S rRNA (guanine(966)-N(2))-methyltransferase RsmD [OM182 bacterium]
MKKLGKTIKGKGRVRIIGGLYRSRFVNFVQAEGLRPTADRVRETAFNWLDSVISNAKVLDLYAGSGVLGIEAISRGAKHVVFVDKNPAVVLQLNQNLVSLKIRNCRVLEKNSEEWLSVYKASAWGNISGPRPVEDEAFDIVFVDPPYGDCSVISSCNLLESSGLLQPNSNVYVELDNEIDHGLMPENWECVKSKRAGKVHFYLYHRFKLSS